ncbi:MAG: hypothetical protein LBE08_08355 [Bifidobacteriaceae bacterium]|jgi:hypothetical protein|nr:hypothetical protein [Bifidobacteriaceae bacterium]
MSDTITFERPVATLVETDHIAEDEWIWGLVVLAILYFGVVALACRAICWGTPKRCATTWYGSLDVVCK